MKTKIIGSLFSLITAFLALTGQAQTQLISNGGFETGSASPWVVGGGTQMISSYGSFAYDGTYYLWLGGAVSENDYAYQTVTIPANASSATLSFYYNIYTLETGTGAYDTFTVALRNTSGVLLTTLGTWSNQSHTPAGKAYYQYQSYNLSAYAGQTVEIYFSSANDSSYPTDFRIDDVSLSVTTTCSYSLSSYSASPAANSGSSTFNVTAGSTCSWTASSDSTSWLHTTSSGSGNGTVSYSYDANSSSSSRTGHITVGGQSFTVTQSGVSCSYSLSSYSASPSSSSGSSSFNVTAGSGCSWAASSDATGWLHTTSSGSGNGTVTYSYDANTSSTARTGHITVGGQSFTVTQAGTSSSQPLGVDVSHHNGTVDWSLVKNSGGKTFALIHATSGINNVPDTQFAANAANAHAVGLLVGTYHFAYPQYYTAHQEAQAFLSVASGYIGTGYLPPALDIEDSAADNSYPYQMGQAVLSQWIRDWCSEVKQATGITPMIYATRWYANNFFYANLTQYPYWVPTYSSTDTLPNSTPTGLSPWTTWTFQQYEADPTTQQGGTGGTCPGISGYALLDSFNGGLSALQALANQTPTCTYSFDTYSSNPGSSSGSGSFNVTSASGCSWSASSDATGWLHTTSSGSGNGTVNYTYDANTATSSRTGHITAGGQSFTVTQSGASVTPSITSPPPGSTFTSSSVTFQWSSGSSVAEYFLYVGTTLGANDLYGQSQGLNLSTTISGLPTDGRTLYVRLYWQIAGTWYASDYTYTAYTLTDTTPPTVSIISPATGTTYTTAQTVNIIASASDNIGLSKVDFYDGSTLKGSNPTGPYAITWSFTSADNGTHVWTARAYDTSGNVTTSSTVSLIVNIPIPDTTAPTVSVNSPANGQTFTSSPITISGTAADPGTPSSGVASVQLQDNSTSGTWQTATGTTSWSASVALTPGSNAIYVRSQDSAGNYSILGVVNVTYNPPDTTAPTVSVNSPANGQTFTTSPITVSGTAADPGSPSSGVASVQLQDNSTSGTWQTATGTTSWSASVALTPGSNAIYVRSQDSAGNYSILGVVNVTYNPPDTTAPTVSVNSPANGQTFTSSPITISGTAADPGSPSSGVASVQLQDNSTSGTWQTATGTTSWSASVALTPGANAIYVRSRDAAGNYSILGVVNVTYNPPDNSGPKQLSGTTAITNGFAFVLNGSIGSNYVIKASSDLINWVAIVTNVIPASGSRVITDPIPTNSPYSRRFYRTTQLTNGPTILQPGPQDGHDIWTTSILPYSTCASYGTGGGLDDDRLRTGGWGDQYYSLLQFDLAGMPTNVTSAVLYLYCFSQDGGGTAVYFDRVTSAWNWKTSGTGCDRDRLWWADRPTYVQLSQLGAPTAGQWYSVDITALYNQWQNGTYPNYGVQFRPLTYNNNNFNNFYSSDYMIDPTLRPKLVITK